MIRTLLVALLLGTLPVAASAQSDVVLFGQGDTQTMYQWVVPWNRFVAQQRWSPASGNPPLPITKAAEVADAWIKGKYPDIKAFSISSIALAVSHTWQGEPQDRWYYKIEFQPMVGGQRLFGGQFIAVVLLVAQWLNHRQNAGNNCE